MNTYLSLIFLASTLIKPSYTRIGNLPLLWQSVLQNQETARIVKTRINLGTKRENSPKKQVMTKGTNGHDQNEKSKENLKIMTILKKLQNYNKNQFVPLNILLIDTSQCTQSWTDIFYLFTNNVETVFKHYFLMCFKIVRGKLFIKENSLISIVSKPFKVVVVFDVIVIKVSSKLGQ